MNRIESPKIVVLDGHTLNPGDLSWKSLEALGHTEVYPRTPSDLIVRRAEGSSVLLTNKTPLSRETLSQLPTLRYIGVLATGYNVVDVGYAASRGIAVTNVPGYGTDAVAQAVFALLLELSNHVGVHSQRVRDGAWSRSIDWCFWEYSLVELSGLTMGIIGYGAIGQAVERLAKAFGMHVVCATRGRQSSGADGITFMDLEMVLQTSDVVSLHCPLTVQTKHCIDARRIGLMKPTAFLLNTARGGLVDEHALAVALNEGRLAGAALDVLSTEPPPDEHPLLRAKNCIVTPHIGWATRAARDRLLRIAVENVRAFLQHTPVNLVPT